MVSSCWRYQIQSSMTNSLQLVAGCVYNSSRRQGGQTVPPLRFAFPRRLSKDRKMKFTIPIVLAAVFAASYLVGPADAGDRAPAAAPAAPAAAPEPTVLFKRTRTVTETPVAEAPVCRDGSCSPVSRLRSVVAERTIKTTTERRSRRGSRLFSRLFKRRSLGCSG